MLILALGSNISAKIKRFESKFNYNDDDKAKAVQNCRGLNINNLNSETFNENLNSNRNGKVKFDNLLF